MALIHMALTYDSSNRLFICIDRSMLFLYLRETEIISKKHIAS
jgi:hypothetical protein